MEIFEYLNQYREEIPEWIRNYSPEKKITFRDVMSGRTSYYPGFGRDGSLLEAANRSHAVHSHIHLDYWNKRKEDIRQVGRIKGYHSIGHIEWKISDILPLGFYRHNNHRSSVRHGSGFISTRRAPHYFTDILERNPEYDDSHGAERMAVTTLCADGIDFYYQLFIRHYNKVAWLFMLQDHGMGGNYDRFGKGGLLDSLLRSNGYFPKFVICENCHGTTIWDYYRKIEGLNPIIGGMHRNVRDLYEYHGGSLPVYRMPEELPQMNKIYFKSNSIRKYYISEFANDLVKYFNISTAIGGVKALIGLGEMKHGIYTSRYLLGPCRGCPAKDTEKSFIFSGLTYFMLLIPRTIERLYGLSAKIDFGLATGWPLTIDQHTEEYHIMKTTCLLPCDAQFENYFRMFREVRSMMLDEIRSYITDPHTGCLDKEAHRRLVETIGSDIENFISELSGMADVFLSNFRLLT